MPELHRREQETAGISSGSANDDDPERTGPVRIQLDLPRRQVDELQALMEATGVATRKEFINNALSLMVWAIKERRKGRVIASLDESNNSYREVVMPMLNHVGK